MPIRGHSGTGVDAVTPRRPRDIGTHAESATVRCLAASGFPNAERRQLRGIRDAGDVTGKPGLAWSVKGGLAAKGASDLDIARWLAELETQRGHAKADIGVLVQQRAGVGETNAHRWWAWLRLEPLAILVDPGSFVAEPIQAAPVRLLLGDALLLLRSNGYGDPITEVAR